MTLRAQAWMRQARNDLEASHCTAAQGFHAQACDLAGQAAEKAPKALLLTAGITPPTSHTVERLVAFLHSQGLETSALSELRRKPLTRMHSNSRQPQGDAAPVDLFDASGGSVRCL